MPRDAVIMARSMAMVESLNATNSKLIPNIHGNLHTGNIRREWDPPWEGWMKLNVDGAFSRHGNVSACGGLLRDSNGKFVRGFIHCMDHGDSIDCDLIKEAKQLMGRDWEVKLQHVHREFNQAADFLAKLGLSSMPGFSMVLHVPPGLDEILRRDWPRIAGAPVV